MDTTSAGVHDVLRHAVHYLVEPHTVTSTTVVDLTTFVLIFRAEEFRSFRLGSAFLHARMAAMCSAFDDRFETDRYRDDEPVHLFRVDRYGPADEQELWIPERIWHRLRLVGAAYELRLIPILDGSTDPLFLSQTSELLDELGFIEQRVDDPLLRSIAAAIGDLLRLPSQGASRDALGIEFP
jgi:hypothetical protein